jgi:hypothetical protein
MQGKNVHFMQKSMKITYFAPNSVKKKLMLQQFVNFLFAIKLSSYLLEGSNIYKF